MRSSTYCAFVWPLILWTGCAAATPDHLFQWKNVNIQGMGYVTGLIATARAGGVSDVYIRTDVGGAYLYDRGQASPRSAQDAAERTVVNRPRRVPGSAGDRWIPLLEGSSFTQGIGVESIATEDLTPARVYVVVNWPTTTHAGSNPNISPAHYTRAAFSGINISATKCFCTETGGSCYDTVYPVELRV